MGPGFSPLLQTVLLETAQTLNCLSNLILLSIVHLEGPAEVQLNSWWKLYRFWLTNTLKEQVSFIWIQVIFISVLGLKIHSFWKNWSRRSLLWCHVALRELVRLSDDLVKRWFCQWDIWSIQLKSNWTAGENWWLILFKRQWTFFPMSNLELYSFRKKLSVKESLTVTRGT